MTPKEKSNDLLCKFQGNFKTDEAEYVKQCALICVDVILKDVGAEDWEDDVKTGNNYWVQVKTEINKL